MISKFRLVACFLVFYFAIAIQAHAQSYDGTYRGTIACDPIPGVTAGPLKTLFTLRVAGDVISYEREVIRPIGESPLGITESGRGSINGESELILTGTAKAPHLSQRCNVSRQTGRRRHSPHRDTGLDVHR